MTDSKEKSLNGGTCRLNKNRTISMRYSTFSRHVRCVAAATAIATTLVIGGGNFLIDRAKDNVTIHRLASEFRTECISPETHRTNDNQHYFYDYMDIADYINNMDDFDTGVYLFNVCTSDYQTDCVMTYTSYNSFDAYLKSHSYADSDDFRKVMRERLTIEDDVRQMLSKAQDIAAEHTDSYEGGQK